jgi:two-component system phosphate regulon response regulator PhoB
MARKALVVEDEHDFASIVALNLKRAGFDAVVARSGEVALIEARRLRPDIVLLDLNLPDVPGTEVCRRLKSDPATRGTPVIMVTARGEEIDRVVGFELGADDYVVKPVSMRELVLRVNAVLRRSSPPAVSEEPSFEIGPLVVDGPGHRVRVGGVEVPVTALEFRLLVTLASNRGRVFTREALLDRVWGIQAELETRTVDTMTKRLRDKMGEAGRYVETVRGVGYRFSDQD